jgi:hypothetical protein
MLAPIPQNGAAATQRPANDADKLESALHAFDPLIEMEMTMSKTRSSSTTSAELRITNGSF